MIVLLKKLHLTKAKTRLVKINREILNSIYMVKILRYQDKSWTNITSVRVSNRNSPMCNISCVYPPNAWSIVDRNHTKIMPGTILVVLLFSLSNNTCTWLNTFKSNSFTVMQLIVILFLQYSSDLHDPDSWSFAIVELSITEFFQFISPTNMYVFFLSFGYFDT